MRLTELVDALESVTATSKRTEKTAVLAELIGRLEPAEVETAIGFLVGRPRQGRIGVGWRTVANVAVLPDGDATVPLELTDVDATIDALQAATGEGSVAKREAMLAALLRRATTHEAEFVGHLFTGGLRTGALEGVVTDAVAKAYGLKLATVRRAAMLSGDLGRTAAAAATGGQEAVLAIGLSPGRPIKPMLASTADSVDAAIDELGLCSVEWKLDGIRIQVHRAHHVVAVFTRNLNDITDRLPAVVAAVRSMPADVLVLDGEAIGWFSESDLPAAFQDTWSGVGSEAGAGDRVTPFFFDLLHHDGEDLIDLPLSDRLERLRSVAGPLTMPGRVTDDSDEGTAILDEALAAGHEGVVVKAIDSPYAAGRRGKVWRKVKPVLTLDLVVLGAEWGHGRRQGWLSNLHLGARSDDGFVMVGKTFKGMTDELLTWQTNELRDLAIDDAQPLTPSQGHVVLVRPERVVEIALDGVQRSTRYPGGVALRFARVRRYRDDKTPADADTIAAVQALLASAPEPEPEDHE